MKERRININIDTDEISDREALACVRSVVGQGRISGDDDTYCYVTFFPDNTVVYAGRTRAGNDTFKVWREGP